MSRGGANSFPGLSLFIGRGQLERERRPGNEVGGGGPWKPVKVILRTSDFVSFPVAAAPQTFRTGIGLARHLRTHRPTQPTQTGG